MSGADESLVAVAVEEGGGDESSEIVARSAKSMGSISERQDSAELLRRAPFVVLGGVIFGMALQKSGVYRGDVLRDQFNIPFFDRADNTMLAIFLAAAAMSCLSIAAMRSYAPTQEVCYNAGANKCA
jgi:hypothetical protein